VNPVERGRGEGVRAERGQPPARTQSLSLVSRNDRAALSDSEGEAAPDIRPSAPLVAAGVTTELRDHGTLTVAPAFEPGRAAKSGIKVVGVFAVTVAPRPGQIHPPREKRRWRRGTKRRSTMAEGGQVARDGVPSLRHARLCASPSVRVRLPAARCRASLLRLSPMPAPRRPSLRSEVRGAKSAPEQATSLGTTASGQHLRADAPHLPEAESLPAPKSARRRHIDPTTCERDYTADEIEFMKAMDDYKRRSGRNFPTWSEVLEVVRSLGYHRD